MTKHNTLFLCTGNAGRSIIAEAILNRVAGDRFCAFSAGSRPRGVVHPAALRLLQAHGYETARCAPRAGTRSRTSMRRGSIW